MKRSKKGSSEAQEEERNFLNKTNSM